MTSGEQRVRGESYRIAAAERVVGAAKLYGLDRYVEACYFAGLAVECILRAYRVMIDPEFDSRHDINELYRLARFADIVPVNELKRINAAMGDVIALWSNRYRFWPQSALTIEWKKKGLYKEEGKWLKGDFVKERTRQLINAAGTIVNTGEARWQVSFKN